MLTKNPNSPQTERLRPAGWLTCMFLMAPLCGCSQPEVPIAGVTGKVTFQGEPVTEGSILFINEQGFGSSAPLQEDGSYLVQSHHGKGIPPGEYSVSVTPPEDVVDPNTGELMPRGTYENIPKKYRDFTTSPLKFTVTDGSNEFLVDMLP